jgi:FkbM family methyltransferase
MLGFKEQLWWLRYRPQNLRLVRHRYGGVPLTVHLADPMSERWYDLDWPEIPEVMFLQRHQLRPGARVFDLGAHQGVVAGVLADSVGSTGQVVAVEANLFNVQVSRINRHLNRRYQIRLVHAAVSDKSGLLRFGRGINGQVDLAGAQVDSQEVRAVTVDELARLYGLPQVLFIDVEGFECHVLRGARETLRSGPDCFVEVHTGAGLEDFGESVHSLLAFFPKDDYALFVANDIDRHPKPLTSETAHFLEDRCFILAAWRGLGGQLTDQASPSKEPADSTARPRIGV